MTGRWQVGVAGFISAASDISLAALVCLCTEKSFNSVNNSFHLPPPARTAARGGNKEPSKLQMRGSKGDTLPAEPGFRKENMERENPRQLLSVEHRQDASHC